MGPSGLSNSIKIATSRRATFLPAISLHKSFISNTYEPPVCVANKRLTGTLTPLYATLTKNTGGPHSTRHPLHASTPRWFFQSPVTNLQSLPVVSFQPVNILLTEIECRVLGSLIEKEIPTPDYYPLS